jgi:hypothetical protein
MVAAFIGSLKVTDIILLVTTLVAPFAGSVDTTTGQIPLKPTGASSFLHCQVSVDNIKSNIHVNLNLLKYVCCFGSKLFKVC